MARTGYVADLQNPKTFNEKVQWRKLHDRNALFPVISDKYAMRQYVSVKLGDVSVLTQLRGVSENPDAEWIQEMAKGGVALKASHASGRNLFLRADAPFGAEKVARKCRRWLDKPYGTNRHEWAYSAITPRVVAEDLMIQPDGRLAYDIKFFMFRDQCGLIDVEWDRFGQHGQIFLDTAWNRLDLRMKQDHWVEAPPMPRQFARMLDVAQILGDDFDHLRVDFLFDGERFALNELTLYNGSGMNPFRPVEWDHRLGATWGMVGEKGREGWPNRND